MNTKRLRIFAGPNGSGKTTLYQLISEHCDLGLFVNADIIEANLRDRGFFDFSSFHIPVEAESFLACFTSSSFYHSANGDELLPRLSFNANGLLLSNPEKLNSYFAAFIADYLRNQIVNSGQKLSVETVMSDKRKFDFFRMARKNGYRIYLYFITTIDAQINLERVRCRTELGGHDVPEEKIRNRYKRSLDNLLEAISLSDRAYLFDNSYSQPQLIAEAENNLIESYREFIPNWYQQYVADKLQIGIK